MVVVVVERKKGEHRNLRIRTLFTPSGPGHHHAWWSQRVPQDVVLLTFRNILSYLALSALVLACLQDGRSLGYFRPFLFTKRLVRSLLEFKEGEMAISVVLKIGIIRVRKHE